MVQDNIIRVYHQKNYFIGLFKFYLKTIKQISNIKASNINESITNSIIYQLLIRINITSFSKTRKLVKLKKCLDIN